MVEPGETWRRKSSKVDEAQASARSCAGRPDFLPCDGVQSACTTHSHGKCFKLHWCCLLGWCHCKYVYQPMTNVLQLPSTVIPSSPADHTPPLSLSALLAERFLRTASCLVSPTSDLRVLAGPSTDDYAVAGINGRAFYIPLARRDETPTPENAEHRNKAELPRALPSCSRSVLSYGKTRPRGETRAHRQALDQGLVGQKSRRGFSPSSLEDSGIPGVDRTYGDLELNEEHAEQIGKALNEEFNEGQWELPALPASGSLQELAEALETTV
ncbi:unnamed protein product [Lota lota]